jgi:O-antigen biosynthesis protein
MKKVAIYYSNKFGRNDGSPLYYYNVLKQNKEFDTYHLIPEGDTSNFGKFDYHFWVDWGEDGLPWREWSIPKDGGKTIYVASDTHLGREYRLNKAKQFDYAFFNQKDAAEEAGGVWLPHAAEPMAYPKIDIIKKYDVCFIGHIQDVVNYNGFTRTDALDRLFKEIPNFYYGSRHPAFPDRNLFEDAGKKFSQSKIVFNISIKDDINMRVFETLSTGSFLLTNWIPTLGDLFEDGKHLETYKTLDEMVEKAKYYLEHDDERELIARTGHEEFIAKHTYKHRVETILSIVDGKK